MFRFLDLLVIECSNGMLYVFCTQEKKMLVWVGHHVPIKKQLDFWPIGKFHIVSS